MHFNSTIDQQILQGKFPFYKRGSREAEVLNAKALGLDILTCQGSVPIYLMRTWYCGTHYAKDLENYLP